MSNTKVVLIDSGGIQEETTFLQIPCLTLRDNTERPITTKLGTNQVVGTNPTTIIQAYRRAVNGSWRKPVIPPPWDGRAAERVVRTEEAVEISLSLQRIFWINPSQRFATKFAKDLHV